MINNVVLVGRLTRDALILSIALSGDSQLKILLIGLKKAH